MLNSRSNVCSEKTLQYCVSETTGTTGNHKGFTCKNAHDIVIIYLLNFYSFSSPHNAIHTTPQTFSIPLAVVC